MRGRRSGVRALQLKPQLYACTDIRVARDAIDDDLARASNFVFHASGARGRRPVRCAVSRSGFLAGSGIWQGRAGARAAAPGPRRGRSPAPYGVRAGGADRR